MIRLFQPYPAPEGPPERHSHHHAMPPPPSHGYYAASEPPPPQGFISKHPPSESSPMIHASSRGPPPPGHHNSHAPCPLPRRSPSGYVSTYPAPVAPQVTVVEQYYYENLPLPPPGSHSQYSGFHGPPDEVARYAPLPGDHPNSRARTDVPIQGHRPIYYINRVQPHGNEKHEFNHLKNKKARRLMAKRFNQSSSLNVSGNALSFIPPGFAHELRVQFPDCRLPVCERCKKYYKTRDTCRLRNRHTGFPWSSIYLCITLDESCIGPDGKSFTQDPIQAQILPWQPYSCKVDLDADTPVCAACKHKNYTKSFCRTKHKHRQLPWSTVYLLVRSMNGNTSVPSTSNSYEMSKGTVSSVSSLAPLPKVDHKVAPSHSVQDRTTYVDPEKTNECLNFTKKNDIVPEDRGEIKTSAEKLVRENFDDKNDIQKGIENTDGSSVKSPPRPDHVLSSTKNGEDVKKGTINGFDGKPSLDPVDTSKGSEQVESVHEDEHNDDATNTSSSNSCSDEYHSKSNPQVCGDPIDEIDESRTFMLEVSHTKIRLQWLNLNDTVAHETMGNVEALVKKNVERGNTDALKSSEVKPPQPHDSILYQGDSNYEVKPSLDQRYEYVHVCPNPSSKLIPYHHSIKQPLFPAPPPRYYDQPPRVASYRYSPPPQSIEHYTVHPNHRYPPPPNDHYSHGGYHERESSVYYDSSGSHIDPSRYEHHSYAVSRRSISTSMHGHGQNHRPPPTYHKIYESTSAPHRNPATDPSEYRSGTSNTSVYHASHPDHHYPTTLSGARAHSGPPIQRHLSAGSSSAHSNELTVKSSPMDTAEAAIARMVAYNYENEKSLPYSHSRMMMLGDVTGTSGSKSKR